MRYPKIMAARRRLAPVAALLLASSLGGCVGYTGYPSGDYGYSQPNYRHSEPNYGYSNYPSSYNQRPYYSPYYGSPYYGAHNAYQSSGG